MNRLSQKPSSLFKAVIWAFGGLFMFMLSGCSSTSVKDYADTKPVFNLFEYFNGKTYAWGQFSDRSGKVIRRFKVNIEGKINGKQLTLDEKFIYHDGERQERVWQITDLGNGHYQGKAGDIVGIAQGETAGSALNWHYTLKLPYKDGTIDVKFNDWMFMHEGQVMLNTAHVSKFGFHVGTVNLFFAKQDLSES